MKNKLSVGLAAIVVFLLVCIVFLFWPSGYGKVSPDAYEAAKAIYGACMSESGERLRLVTSLVDGDSDGDSGDDSIRKLEISDTERQWLQLMIEKAEGGDWKVAAAQARQMMKDQVDF